MTILADRLVAARKACGLNQDTAAVHLGMSRPTFIAIEKGTREPKPSELLGLAKLYNTSVNALLRQSTPPLKIAPHLRSVMDKSRRLGDTADMPESNPGLDDAISKLTTLVDDYQFLEAKTQNHGALNAPPRRSHYHGNLNHFAELCAQEERVRLGIGTHEPIAELRKTLEEVGVHVFLDGLDSKLAGLYAFVETFGYCILVNRKHPRVRRRWTIAHEYGHFLFDRDRPGVDYLEPMLRKPENERFADAFAAAFLMPNAGVERRFSQIFEQNRDVNVGDVCRMANFYGVSLAAMTLRLEYLGHVPKGSWDSIKASGVRVTDIQAEAGVNEQCDSDSLELFPERYIMLAVQAWFSETISIGQFAKLLRRSPIEARELAQRRSRLFDDASGKSEQLSIRLTDSLFAERAPQAA